MLNIKSSFKSAILYSLSIGLILFVYQILRGFVTFNILDLLMHLLAPLLGALFAYIYAKLFESFIIKRKLFAEIVGSVIVGVSSVEVGVIYDLVPNALLVFIGFIWGYQSLTERLGKKSL